MTKLDSYTKLSEQDYGPWHDGLDLYESKGKFYLCESYGYQKPYDEQWYLLSARPKKSLKKAFKAYHGGFCGAGEETVGFLTEDLGVEVSKTTKPV